MKYKWIDPQTKKEWVCSNCGGKWMEGSPSCPYAHTPSQSILRKDLLPYQKISKSN